MVYKKVIRLVMACLILPLIFIEGANAEVCSICGNDSINCWVDEEGVVYCKNVLIRYPDEATAESYTVDKRCTTIGESAFDGNQHLLSLVIQDGLTMVCSSAFATTNLESVVLPESLLIIDDGAFMNCHRLKSVTLPSSVYAIGSSAFVECPLSVITIPASVRFIGSEAFAKTAITDVYFEDAYFYATDAFVRNNDRQQITFHFPAYAAEDENWAIEHYLELYNHLGSDYEVLYDITE